MILPIKRKLTILQGATFRRRFTWKPGGVPADFTGSTARMQVRADIDSPVVLLELTTENGGIVLGAEPGTVDLYIGARQTALIGWEGGVFDLEIQYAGGPDDVDRLLAGSVAVLREATRANA